MVFRQPEKANDEKWGDYNRFLPVSGCLKWKIPLEISFKRHCGVSGCLNQNVSKPNCFAFGTSFGAIMYTLTLPVMPPHTLGKTTSRKVSFRALYTLMPSNSRCMISGDMPPFSHWREPSDLYTPTLTGGLGAEIQAA